MKAASGVEMLQIPAAVMGRPESIHPVLFRDKGAVILVDTGYPGLLPQFRDAMDHAGVPFKSLDKIILTHHDADHMGGLSDMLKALPGRIEVLAHEAEKPYIEGDKPPTKLALFEANPASLSEPMKALYENLKAFYLNNKIHVDRTLSDGEELPYCGGITVIYTPGHTPGHISLYHKQSRTLIAGDALFVEGGQLVKAPARTNSDQESAQQSLKKLAQYDIEAVICYHGGLFRGDAARRIAELADA